MMISTSYGPPSADNTIRFVLDGEVRTVRDIPPTLTILTYLRDTLRRTGTKEGCAEGDCGACTVVVAELQEENLRFRAVNACIQFVPTLDGKALTTVEGLRESDGRLHPVQRAMVECHASQCGFCTPGMVMSLFALYRSTPKPARQRIIDTLAGNLCRCTGYRAILAAAETMYAYGRNEQKDEQQPPQESAMPAEDRTLIEQLRAIQRRDMLAQRGERQFFAPTDITTLASLLQRYQKACILAGGTDIGPQVTKQHRLPDTLIYIGKVEALTRLEISDSHIEIGAAVPLTEVSESLARYYADMGELLRRFASPPIRNVATLGGNIATGSPVGDSMPALIVLGATLVLRRGAQCRELPLDAFYVSYRRTALQPGEFIERIRLPLPSAQQHFRAYKVAKRFDQDISAVSGAYSVILQDDRVAAVRICYGGLAATPKRARQCEQALQGRPWAESSLSAAMAALDRDYTPLTDLRASSDYRRLVAKNLLWKFFLETSGQAYMTRVLDYRT